MQKTLDAFDGKLDVLVLNHVRGMWGQSLPQTIGLLSATTCCCSCSADRQYDAISLDFLFVSGWWLPEKDALLADDVTLGFTNPEPHPSHGGLKVGNAQWVLVFFGSASVSQYIAGSLSICNASNHGFWFALRSFLDFKPSTTLWQ